MINYELFRRNFDSERLSYIITELLLCRASYMVTDIVKLLSVGAKPSLLSHAIKFITLLFLWVGSFNRYNTKNTGVQTRPYLGITHN